MRFPQQDTPIQHWPIGCLFISTVDTDPALLLGYGVWSAFGAGRVLVGYDATDAAFDTLGETGGSKTHTLTVAELPAHTHTQNAHAHTQTVNSAATGGLSGYTADTSTNTAVNSGYSTASVTAVNNNTGSDAPHNNLQPYICVMFWRRTG